MSGRVLLVIKTGAAVCAVLTGRETASGSTHIAIGDVIELSCLSDKTAGKIRHLSTTDVSGDKQTIELPSLDFVSLSGWRAPTLAQHLVEGGREVRNRFSNTKPNENSESELECFKLSASVQSGQMLTVDVVERAACVAGRPTIRITYDRASKAVRAARSEPAGAYLGQITPISGLYADVGDQITVTASSGPVRVQRTMTLLQPAYSGQPAFVQDEQGKAIRVDVIDPEFSRQ